MDGDVDIFKSRSLASHRCICACGCVYVLWVLIEHRHITNLEFLVLVEVACLHLEAQNHCTEDPKVHLDYTAKQTRPKHQA